MVDTGMVPDHMLNYGSRYIPAWEFESKLRELIAQPHTITDALPPPMLPKRMTWTLPTARIARALRRRLGLEEH
jgi:hypothetical protein